MRTILYINGLRKSKSVSYEGNYLTKTPTGGRKVVMTMIDLKGAILIIRNLHVNSLGTVFQNMVSYLDICRLEIKKRLNMDKYRPLIS